MVQQGIQSLMTAAGSDARASASGADARDDAQAQRGYAPCASQVIGDKAFPGTPSNV